MRILSDELKRAASQQDVLCLLRENDPSLQPLGIPLEPSSSTCVRTRRVSRPPLQAGLTRPHDQGHVSPYDAQFCCPCSSSFPVRTIVTRKSVVAGNYRDNRFEEVNNLSDVYAMGLSAEEGVNV